MTWAGETPESGIYTFTEDGSPGAIAGNEGDLIRWGQAGTAEFVDPASITGVIPFSHNLLSSQHGDTEPGAATDGDLVFASGTEWARLPVGSPTGLILTIGEDSRPQWLTSTGAAGEPGPPGEAGASKNTFDFKLNGKPTVLTKLDGTWVAGSSGTITDVTFHRETAGSAGSGVIDVNIDGTTIYTTQVSRPAITAAGGDDQISSTTPDVTLFFVDEKFTVDIDEIETGNSLDYTVIIQVDY